jgi:hypothetical protein
MNAFIMVANSSNWCFDVENLIRNITERWPGTTFRAPAKTRVSGWTIRLSDLDGKSLSGFLAPDLKHIGFDGYEEPCTKFAIWIRSMVPSEVPLLLGDEHHGDTVHFLPDVTENEILDFWRSDL